MSFNEVKREYIWYNLKVIQEKKTGISIHNDKGMLEYKEIRIILYLLI